MFGLVIAIHVVVCSLLITIVLIQQGRGGGLIDSLSSAENIFGTKTSAFLVKSTSVLAVIFFFTCLSLAFLSIRRGKSLLETTYWQTKQASVPAAAPAASKPASAPAASPSAPAQASKPAVPLNAPPNAPVEKK
jgi:preprotein translocase subunit SecG